MSETVDPRQRFLFSTLPGLLSQAYDYVRSNPLQATADVAQAVTPGGALQDALAGSEQISRSALRGDIGGMVGGAGAMGAGLLGAIPIAGMVGRGIRDAQRMREAYALDDAMIAQVNAARARPNLRQQDVDRLAADLADNPMRSTDELSLLKEKEAMSQASKNLAEDLSDNPFSSILKRFGLLGTIGAGGYLRSNVSDSHSGGTLSVSVLSIGSTVSISAGYGVTSNWSPNVANSLSVGQSSRPWNSVYAQDTTINTSDARGKTDIELSPLGLEFVNALRPVKFRRTLSHNVPHVNEDGSAIGDENGEQTYTSVPGTRPHYGFIAQEIKETYPRFVDDFGGWVIADPSDPDSSQFLRYTEFISPIVKAIQELSEKVVSLEARIQEMEG
jgi:hypothetical protein